MKDLTALLKKAREKKVFTREEFEDVLAEILALDPALELDWDDGAGEYWARFIDEQCGIACMVSAKVALAFVRDTYAKRDALAEMGPLEVVLVNDYSSEEWSINVKELKANVPEIPWTVSEASVNASGMSLQDFYWATV